MLHPWQHEHRQRRAALCSLLTILGLAFLAACSSGATPQNPAESELDFLLPKPPSSKLRGHAVGVSSPSLRAAASGVASSSGAVGALAFTMALATALFSAGGRHRALIRRHAGGKPLEELNVGDACEGTVKRVANIGVWIDIGAAKDALLAKNEIPPGKSYKPQEKVKDLEIIEVQAGDTPATRKIRLKAMQVELSVNEGDVVEGTVMRSSSFGVFFDIGIGFDVLAPNRELSAKPDEYAAGDKVKVTIVSIAGNRVTVTTRIDSSSGSQTGKKGAGKPLSSLKEGTVVSGVVTNASEKFGLFMDIGVEKDVLWRIQQLDKPLSDYTAGEKVDGLKIVSVNVEKKLVEVTKRRLTSEVEVGETFEGTVNEVTQFGVFFNVGLSSDVLATAGGLSKQVDKYTKGEVADLKVIKVDGARVNVTTILEETVMRGQTVSGKVVSIKETLGIFIDVGDSQQALLRIKSLGDKSLSDFSVGEELKDLIVMKLDRAEGIFEVITREGLDAVASNPVTSLANLPVGSKVSGKVSKVTQFGIFVDVGAQRDALWATSQLPKAASEFKEGEEVTGLTITECNPDLQRLSVSSKPTAAEFNKGDLVSGKVSKILPFGIFVDIGASNDALVPARFLAKEPTEYQEGEEFQDWKILQTVPNENKISVCETEGSSGSSGRLSFDDLTVGQAIKGVVRRSTNFGVFVDIGLGRTDALLPGSLMKKGVNPEDFEPNNEAEVYIHKIDSGEGRVTVGMEKPEDVAQVTYQTDWIPPGCMLPDVKMWKLDGGIVDDEPINYREWEKKYPGMIKFPTGKYEVEPYFCISKSGGPWHGEKAYEKATVHHIPIPVHLRKPDAAPPVIPKPHVDDYDCTYDTGIKPEIHTKYRAPPMNDPNWVWYEKVPEGVSVV